jgi:hypothetical protein
MVIEGRPSVFIFQCFRRILPLDLDQTVPLTNLLKISNKYVDTQGGEGVLFSAIGNDQG